MARVWIPTQCIEDPHVEIAQSTKTRRWNPADVARIGKAAEAKSERSYIAVILQEWHYGNGSAGAFNGQGHSGHQPVRGRDRRIAAAGRRLEAIRKPGLHHRRGLVVKVNVKALPPFDKQRA